MSMYDRIKTMTAEEMRHFIYWVYMCGNEDGQLGLQDSPSGFFGGYMLTKNTKEVMPNDDVQDLWNDFDETYVRNTK